MFFSTFEKISTFNLLIKKKLLKNKKIQKQSSKQQNFCLSPFRQFLNARFIVVLLTSLTTLVNRRFLLRFISENNGKQFTRAFT